MTNPTDSSTATTSDFECVWRAWRDMDEPDCFTEPRQNHAEGIYSEDGQALAELVVWQMSNNDFDDALWHDGMVIVHILEPAEFAGIYGVEIERKASTSTADISDAERAEIMAAINEVSHV